MLKANKLYFVYSVKGGRFESLAACNGDDICEVNTENDSEVEAFINILEDENTEKYTFNIKPLYAYAFSHGFEIKNVKMDLMLAAYLLNPSAKDYDIENWRQSTMCTMKLMAAFRHFPKPYILLR